MRVRSPVALGSCRALMTRALLERALLERALLDRALLDRPLLLRPLDDKPLLERPFSEVSGSSSFTIPASEAFAQARAPVARAQDSKSNGVRRMLAIYLSKKCARDYVLYITSNPRGSLTNALEGL